MKIEDYIEIAEAIVRKLPKATEGMTIAIMQEVAKDARMEQIRTEKGIKEAIEPATPRQISFLKSLGIDKPNVSKQEASKLIEEKIRKA